MGGRAERSDGDVRDIASELRSRLGLFSFEADGAAAVCPTAFDGPGQTLGIRPGGIVEWLVASPGGGAVSSTLHLIARSSFSRGMWAIVDAESDCYAAALPGWDVSLGRVLLIRPTARRELCWAVEQCLRCPGVSATWAWVDRGVPERVHRRWQLAAEVGGGVGMFFRPDSARGEPTWADVRLLATPRGAGREDVRQLRIDVLYRRGGSGGAAQLWEIDHAEGAVRLVPEVAGPAAATRAARA